MDFKEFSDENKNVTFLLGLFLFALGTISLMSYSLLEDLVRYIGIA